jgi:hypothetical protein
MPDNTESQSLNHIQDAKTQHTNYLVRNDPELQGEVDIDVRTDGRFDVTVYKGDSHEPKKVEDISKKRLLELLDDQL